MKSGNAHEARTQLEAGTQDGAPGSLVGTGALVRLRASVWTSYRRPSSTRRPGSTEVAMVALTAVDFAIVWIVLLALLLLVGYVVLTRPHHRR